MDMPTSSASAASLIKRILQAPRSHLPRIAARLAYLGKEYRYSHPPKIQTLNWRVGSTIVAKLAETTHGSIGRPLLKHACPLPDCQPDSRSVLYRLCKNVPRFVEIIAGIQQPVDLRTVFGPLLQLVKIAVVRIERIVCLFVGPIVHAQRTKTQSCQ